MVQPVRFPETVWTRILQAKSDSTSLDGLLQEYRPPILAFLMNRDLTPEDAEDICQEVLWQISQEKFLQKADRAKGRFRSVVLGVVKNLYLKHRERQSAQKRGGGVRTISLEQLRSDSDPEIPLGEEDEEFNRLWFENVFRLCLRRLQQECSRSGKRHFETMRLRLSGLSYKEIAERLEISETDVINSLHAARERLRRYAEVLIRAYSSHPDEYLFETNLYQRQLDGL